MPDDPHWPCQPGPNIHIFVDEYIHVYLQDKTRGSVLLHLHVWDNCRSWSSCQCGCSGCLCQQKGKNIHLILLSRLLLFLWFLGSLLLFLYCINLFLFHIIICMICCCCCCCCLGYCCCCCFHFFPIGLDINWVAIKNLNILSPIFFTRSSQSKADWKDFCCGNSKKSLPPIRLLWHRSKTHMKRTPKTRLGSKIGRW